MFKEVGWNRFLIEFQGEKEKNRVMQGLPLSFDKFLACLKDCDGKSAPKDIQFDCEPFRLQLHDMPFTGMNKSTGEKLGETAGKVIMVDMDGSGKGRGKFFRVKVLVDITIPLARGQVLNIGDKRVWITFKYEKLPNFCFHCGVINTLFEGALRLTGKNSG